MGTEVIVASVRIEPETPVVGVGDRLAFSATALDGMGEPVIQGAGIARWESSDPSVAPISSSGEVIGAAIGTTTITATFLDTSASVELQVVDVAVSSVEVLPARVVFTIGDTFDFVAVARDENGDRIDMAGLDPAWGVVDESIATVSGSTVTAVGAGTTSLVATISGVEGTAELVVEDAVLEGIAIEQSDLTLAPTDRSLVSAAFTWQDAAPANLPTVDWRSSDDSVATVDTGGNISAVAPGSATFTATVGAFSDTLTVDVVDEFEEVATGADHACGRVRSAVFCWGSDADGQLGHDETDFGRAGTTAFTQVVAGRAHTCAKTATNQVWCWGDNANGQLGLGDNSPRDVPTQVSGTYMEPLWAAGDVTCTGSMCWGDLPGGAANAPTSVTGTLAVGGSHSCTIESGTTTCTGDNTQGQLGINTTSATGTGTPAGGYTFSALALGDFFSCGIVTGGGFACWGDGDEGQIGDGNFTDALVPILVGLPTTVGTADAGTAHVCVRLGSGAVHCWGDNTEGQCGDGGRSDNGAPEEVAGSRVYTGVSVEGNHSCATDDAGTIWCWGNGNANPTEVVPTW